MYVEKVDKSVKTSRQITGETMGAKFTLNKGETLVDKKGTISSHVKIIGEIEEEIKKKKK
jgi:hypothetical protein